MRAAAKKRLLRLADRGDRDRELLRARQIAADDLYAPLACSVREFFDQLAHIHPRRRADGDERELRLRSHRCEIGQIHGQRFARDETQRNVAFEIDVLDEHVVRDHLIADGRGIVPGARKELANARDEIGFAHRTGTIGASGRSNVSRG